MGGGDGLNYEKCDLIKFKRINITVIEDIDFIFRKFASQKYKFEKGWYSKAVVEAMLLGILQNEIDNKDLDNIFLLASKYGILLERPKKID